MQRCRQCTNCLTHPFCLPTAEDCFAGFELSMVKQIVWGCLKVYFCWPWNPLRNIKICAKGPHHEFCIPVYLRHAPDVRETCSCTSTTQFLCIELLFSKRCPFSRNKAWLSQLTVGSPPISNPGRSKRRLSRSWRVVNLPGLLLRCLQSHSFPQNLGRIGNHTAVASHLYLGWQ